MEEGDDDILKSTLLLRSEDRPKNVPGVRPDVAAVAVAVAGAVTEARAVGPNANAETNEVLVLLMEQ